MILFFAAAVSAAINLRVNMVKNKINYTINISIFKIKPLDLFIIDPSKLKVFSF